MAKKHIKNQNKMISLIIPAYKQERTIEKDLHRVKKTLDNLKRPYEIIVVVDGKILDKTFSNAKHIKSSKVSIVGYANNRGKGYAVRFGMVRAKGNIIAFLDAGMDLDPESLVTLLQIMENKKADIVIGSKLHPLSKISYPIQRRILSWGYRTFVRIFFGLSIRDTQVGIKFFKRKVLTDVLPLLLVKQYAFDIEILAVSHHLGYTNIQEAPITLTFNKWSSITSRNFWKTIIQMLWDTVAVYYRIQIIKYYDKQHKRKRKYDPELGFRINIVE